jgi:hypothetical protein
LTGEHSEDSKAMQAEITNNLRQNGFGHFRGWPDPNPASENELGTAGGDDTLEAEFLSGV